MFLKLFKMGCVAGLLAISVLGTSGCSGQEAPARASEKSGTLSMPLTSTTNGHSYRLSNFEVWLYPDYQYLRASDGPEGDVLTTELATGEHRAYLFSWSLERDDGSGNFAPVSANLVSDSVVQFEILNGSSTSISFEFETPEERVVIGSGVVRVAARVKERPSACAPLSTDCGEGLWCPPAGLTGMPIACRTVGTVELGASCAAPDACIANSSCIDAGSGPVCTALCPLEDVGSPCASGGTCTSAGPDYGICAP